MCVYTTSFLRFLYLYDCLLLQFCAKLFVHVCVHGNLNINACVCIYARVCVCVRGGSYPSQRVAEVGPQYLPPDTELLTGKSRKGDVQGGVGRG